MSTNDINNEHVKFIHRIPITYGVTFPYQLSDPVGDEKPMVILDCETTGFDHNTCKIIELGLVKVMYSPSKNIFTQIMSVYSGFEDPCEPLTDDVISITGITDEMVSGQKIDRDVVDSFLQDLPFVVAHNAGFDRKFFDAKFPEYSNLPWACTIKEIDWKAKGISSNSLEFILYKLGFFFDAHRASTDCLATLWAIHTTENALLEIRTNAMMKTFIVRAFGAPFESKDLLKSNGFSWHDGSFGFAKCWHKTVKENELAELQDFLNGIQRYHSNMAYYRELTAFDRYKEIVD